jgi:hypothetical protein
MANSGSDKRFASSPVLFSLPCLSLILSRSRLLSLEGIGGTLRRRSTTRTRRKELSEAFSSSCCPCRRSAVSPPFSLLIGSHLADGSIPQVWLADRLVRHHLKSRIVACGPEVKSGLSTFTWTIESVTPSRPSPSLTPPPLPPLSVRSSLSNQAFQPTKNAMDLSDANGSSYTWKIFENFEEKRSNNDPRTGCVTHPPCPLLSPL